MDFPGETRKPAMAADHYSINNADTHDRDHAVQTNSKNFMFSISWTDQIVSTYKYNNSF